MKKWFRKALAATAVALVTTTAAACGSGEADSGSGQLTIGTFSGAMPDLPIYVAQRMGYFDGNGLKVKTVAFPAAPAAVAALYAGSIDITPANALNVIQANLKNSSDQQKVVTVYGLQDAAAWGLVATPRLGVSAADDFTAKMDALRGRTIGVPALGSDGHNILKVLLDHAGMNPESDVRYLAVGVGSSALSAFEAGQVDAVMTVAPVSTLLEKRGGGVGIFNTATSTEIPELNPYAYGIEVTTAAIADRKTEEMKAFQASLDQAMEYIKNPGNAAELAQIWAEGASGLGVDVVGPALETFGSTFTGRLSCRGIDNNARLGVVGGLITEAQIPPCESIVWSEATRYFDQ